MLPKALCVSSVKVKAFISQIMQSKKIISCAFREDTELFHFWYACYACYLKGKSLHDEIQGLCLPY
jgi:hypothetical protein